MRRIPISIFIPILLGGLTLVASQLQAATPKTPSRLSDYRFSEDMPDSLRYELVSDLLKKIISRKPYNRTRFGIDIREVGGRPVFQYREDAALKPASTLKVITTAVALEKLGPEFRYHTVITTDGELTDSVLDGNLIIHGTADPQLSGFFDGEIIGIVSEWADQLQAAGIRKITGSVFLDNSYFSDDDGKLLTKTATVALFDKADKSQLVRQVRNKKGKLIQQKIRLRRSARKLVQINLNNYLADRLAGELARRDMISNKTVELASEQPDSVQFNVLIAHQSPSLAEIIKRTNKESDNFYADQLLRTLGYEVLGTGSLEAGIRVTEAFLAIRLGIDHPDLTIADGSGLSHENRITADMLVRTLEYMAIASTNKDVFYNSLSIPTIDGTLERRIRHPLATQIRAKTGSITGVVTLTGYMSTQSGKELVFSILCNGGRASRLKSLEDEICKLLLNI
ncbi:MAG: D-alanyl-D-alanine carboxypeptidase/D-alanyl-D-alanine-endopeptidase [Bacteroidetes bacterium]|nr:D-alanyl-D-alanine carboxypeptidase/D-alanyl-D-alanine-endopeptidase [Bacteroidota bacterium]